MNTLTKLVLCTGLAAAAILGTSSALAQSTDGFHTIQVFPVVVDSTSFTQRFTFRNLSNATITISPTYFPGGGAQTTALGCPGFTIAALQDRTFASLRSICPALAAGSEFGYLYTYEIDITNHPYSGYSRVSNPQGNGFSVEAFAAKEFTSAPSSIAGIRRQASTVSNPTFQTNCFIGVMNDYTGPATATVGVNVNLRDSAGTQIGNVTQYLVKPGTLTRLLDVFASVGAPAGDYIDARFTASSAGGSRAGVMSYCTVQDNTSFGADFRIAKQEVNQSGEGPSVIAAQSDYVSRSTNQFVDVTASGPGFAVPAVARPFEIAAVNGSANTHVIYFHHPDWVQCEILDASTGIRALNSYGLEMRLMDNKGVAIAGGDNLQGFGEIYLGDKNDYNTGADGRYTIEVENNGLNTASTRPYGVHCQSGSGSTLGELIKYQEAVDRF